MKKILLILLLSVNVSFAVHNPLVPDTLYVLPVFDAWQQKSLTSGWNAARNSATASSSNIGLQGDSLAACYVAGSSTASVPTWEFGRPVFISDTINGGDFQTTYFAGYKPRLDSIRFRVRAYGKVDSSFCTGKVYAVLNQSNPGASISTAFFNDWRTGTDSTAFDSVALSTAAGWWTFRSGAKTGTFKNLMNTVTNQKFFIQLVICNDYTNDSVAYTTLPTSRTFYEAIQFTFSDTTGTDFDPRFEVFWTDTTASLTPSGGSILSTWVNGIKSSWKGIKSWRGKWK